MVTQYSSNSPTLFVDPSGLEMPVWEPTDAEIRDRERELNIALNRNPWLITTPSQPNQARLMPWWGTRRSRSRILQPVGVLNVDPMPAGWRSVNINSGNNRGVSGGAIPSQSVIGPGGCGPCVGVILAPSVDPTTGRLPMSPPVLIFHFSAGDDPSVTLAHQLSGWRGSYSAVINGAQAQSANYRPGISMANWTLLNTLNFMASRSIDVQYVPSGSIGIGQNGQIYNTTPATADSADYDKWLDHSR